MSEINTYDDLRMKARAEIRAEVERVGDPELVKIFDLWSAIEIITQAGKYAGFTTDGKQALEASGAKLSELLAAREDRRIQHKGYDNPEWALTIWLEKKYFEITESIFPAWFQEGIIPTIDEWDDSLWFLYLLARAYHENPDFPSEYKDIVQKVYFLLKSRHDDEGGQS